MMKKCWEKKEKENWNKILLVNFCIEVDLVWHKHFTNYRSDTFKYSKRWHINASNENYTQTSKENIIDE